MKNFLVKDKFKLTGMISTLVLFIYYVYIKYQISSGWCIDNCTYEYKNSFLDPTIIYLQFLLPVLAILLLLPANFFKRFVLYVLSWYLPLSFFLIASESPYNTGGFLGLAGRKFSASLTGFGLLVVTAVFLLVSLGWLGYKYWKNRKRSIDKV
ncbi:MAG: hypothetical protein ACK42D_01115 [Candidatus Paceibacteria bacterium]